VKFFRQTVVWSVFSLALGFMLAAAGGCQTTRNLTYVLVLDSNGTKITADGGSNAKPISLKDVSATVPMGGM